MRSTMTTLFRTYRPSPGRSTSRQLIAAAILTLATIWLAACGGGDEPPAVTVEPTLTRYWAYETTPAGAMDPVVFGDKLYGGDNESGLVAHSVTFPPSARQPSCVACRCRAAPIPQARSSRTGPGRSTARRSNSPVAVDENDYALATSTYYRQVVRYRKIAADATVSFTVSKLWIASAGGNPWYSEGCAPADFYDCAGNLTGEVKLEVQLGRYERPVGAGLWEYSIVKEWDSKASLHGLTEAWGKYNETWTNPIWGSGDLVLDRYHLGARVTLARPIKVTVPLDAIAVDGRFFLHSQLTVSTYNGQQAESGISAMLRDPVDANGIDFEVTGAVPEPERLADPQPTMGSMPLPPVCAGPVDPEAGVLTFARAGRRRRRGPHVGARAAHGRQEGRPRCARQDRRRQRPCRHRLPRDRPGAAVPRWWRRGAPAAAVDGA